VSSPDKISYILKVIALKVSGFPWIEGSPVAAIVAVPDGVAIAAKARPCIHVFRDGGGEYSFADGVIAVKDKCIVLQSNRPWPELYKVLEKVPRDYFGLVNTSEGEPPFLRVKNLLEDGYTADPPKGDDRYAAWALKILFCWNRWNGQHPTGWKERASDLYGGEAMSKMSETRFNSIVDLLQKTCTAIGLKNGRIIDFDGPYEGIVACLEAAKKIE